MVTKKELAFRKILEVMDPEFAEFMLEEDFRLLTIDGTININPFEFAKNYWSKSLEDVTCNANANIGNTGEHKSFCNLVAETVTPVNKLSALYLFRKYGNKMGFNGDELVKNVIDGRVYYHNLSLTSLPYSEFEDSLHIVRINNQISFKTSKEIYESFNKEEKIEFWNGKAWKNLIGTLRKLVDPTCTFVRLKNGAILGLTGGHIVPTFCPHCGVAQEEKPINELREVKDNLKFCNLPEIQDIPIEIDNDTLILLGLWIAEGSGRVYWKDENDTLNTEGRGSISSYLFQIACTQPEIIDFIERYSKERGYSYRKDPFRIAFHKGKGWLTFLRHLGFNVPCLAHTKNLPSWAINLPYEQAKLILKGMYSGDGCSLKSKEISGSLRIKYSTTSWQLTIGLCYILRKFGYNPWVYTSLYSNFEMGGFKNNDIFTVNLYGYDANRFITEIGFLNKHKNKEICKSTDSEQCRKFDDEIVPIHSINKDRKTRGIYQYDFEVEGNYYMSGTGILVHNCIGLSTYPLVTEGLTFGSLTSSPPKRPTSFTNQVIRFIQIASNHFAGATALTDYLQNYSWFTLQNPSYTDKERENDFQNLIHGISDEIRYASQSPFVNVSISSPDTMRNTMGGYMWGKDTKISDLMDEIMKNQLLYSRFIAKGQLHKGEPIGLPYRFPITTLVADPSFKKEYESIWEEILKGNANLCHLNIFNNMKTDLKSLSMCCRLSVDISKLLNLSINNTFGSFLQIGSHGVCTVNLPRIAYETKDESKFIEILKMRMQVARRLLLIHRKEILQKRRIKFHYFFQKGYLSLDHHFFSTIGFIGISDALEIMGMKITEPSGLKFAIKILQEMKNETVSYTESDGVMYNIEEVPAESASGTLAQKDKLLFNGKYDYYNSQFVPLSYDVDVFKRIEIEGSLQTHCTGGSISHINLDGRPDPEALYKFTNAILNDSELKQFAFNTGFTICKTGHNTMGVYPECPTCHSKDLDFVTRVVGYFSPTSQWSRVKQLEFKNRRWNKI